MEDGKKPVATGSCLCGGVRYRVCAPMSPHVRPCHCTMCRKQSGHFAAYVTVERWSGVAIEGEENLAWYQASDIARRGFCRTCGSQLFWVPNDAEHGDVSGGTLEEHPPLQVNGHIFVADMGRYYAIHDPVPLFDADAKD